MMTAPTTPAGGRGHGTTWRVPRRLGGCALAGDRRRGGVGGGGLARALAPRVRRGRDRAGGRGRPRRLWDTGAAAGLEPRPPPWLRLACGTLALLVRGQDLERGLVEAPPEAFHGPLERLPARGGHHGLRHGPDRLQDEVRGGRRTRPPRAAAPGSGPPAR